jgi:hypothetical protein
MKLLRKVNATGKLTLAIFHLSRKLSLPSSPWVLTDPRVVFSLE